jgi:hypothetical protein
MVGFRDFNICCTSERPQVRAYYQSKYVGRIEETTILNCCCISTVFAIQLDQKYQEFKIYRADDSLAFRVTARSGQRGQFVILPFWGFDKIRYTIKRAGGGGIESDSDDDIQRPESLGPSDDGEIVHLFLGFAEYTSKLDKYGITLPENSTE